MSRIETVTEFLARGGKITSLPYLSKSKDYKEQTVYSTTGGPAVIFSLEDGSLMYGEPEKTQRSTKQVKPTLDINALPPHLRKKFIDPLLEENNV